MNVDKHLHKIILEQVQICCAVNIENGLPSPYKVSKGQMNHPLTKWIRSSFSNFLWIVDNIYALHEEWKFRYDHSSERKHRSLEIFESMETPYRMPELGLTPIPKCMGVQFQVENEPNSLIPVRSYKKYYLEGKTHLFSWTKREVPEFILKGEY